MKMYWYSEPLAKVINQDFVAVAFTRQERFLSWAESLLRRRRHNHKSCLSGCLPNPLDVVGRRRFMGGQRAMWQGASRPYGPGRLPITDSPGILPVVCLGANRISTPQISAKRRDLLLFGVRFHPYASPILRETMLSIWPASPSRSQFLFHQKWRTSLKPSGKGNTALVLNFCVKRCAAISQGTKNVVLRTSLARFGLPTITSDRADIDI